MRITLIIIPFKVIPCRAANFLGKELALIGKCFTVSRILLKGLLLTNSKVSWV